jgi:hypothetical protein
MDMPTGQAGEGQVSGNHRLFGHVGHPGTSQTGGGRPFVHAAPGGQVEIFLVDADGKL